MCLEGLGCCYLMRIEILVFLVWKGNCLMRNLIKIYIIINNLGNVVIGLFFNRMVEEYFLNFSKVRLGC